MTTRIKTPHAAIKIWNYQDRLGADGAIRPIANEVREEIVSTISCTNIQTSKSKGEPTGSFSFVLAPTRNWTSVITPGSWCVIMMSNDPITQKSFEKADPKLVKMIGKIDTVRTEVVVDSNGTRQTRYLVSGQDWGCIFNDILYVDPLIADPADRSDQQGNALFLYLIEILFRKGSPAPISVYENLWALLSVAGTPFKIPAGVSRLAKATHELLFPSQMAKFFQFLNPEGVPSTQTKILKNLKLQSGKLNSEDNYVPASDGVGWVDPYSLAGSHTLWQVLIDNSNYALNEMFNEICWKPKGPQLTLFNRIKPFSFRERPLPGTPQRLRSPLKYVKTHLIDIGLVKSVNAGTNWKDKFNFVEVKPNFNDFAFMENWTNQKSQAYTRLRSGKAAPEAFNREGFRPIFFSVRQFPMKKNTDKDAKTSILPDLDLLEGWANLIKEWYFDCHRLLNGELVMTGSTEYIGVGENIMFDAKLIGVTPNYNEASLEAKECFILGHVESVRHSFTVGSDGSRQFQTTIQFVRGIVVDKQKELIGLGMLDTLGTAISQKASKNTTVVVTGNSEFEE